MLSIIADGFGPTFAQVSRVQGNEVAVLTVDPAGHFAVFYRPNTELGYINPVTGDLLSVSQLEGTSSISVIDAVIGGSGTLDAGLTNVSQLVGMHYSNGQLIASDANTIFHQTGSALRSGANSWTYVAGGTLEATSIGFFWSNGNTMKSQNTFKHPNTIVVRNLSGTMLYAANTTFYNNSTGQEFYPASVVLKDTSGNYFYETGAQLDTANVIYYPSGATMIDQNGNAFNEDGSAASVPFTQYHSFTNSEVTSTVTSVDSTTTIATKQAVAGSTAAYVTRINLI